jgi:hypothetical protein
LLSNKSSAVLSAACVSLSSIHDPLHAPQSPLVLPGGDEASGCTSGSDLSLDGVCAQPTIRPRMFRPWGMRGRDGVSLFLCADIFIWQWYRHWWAFGGCRPPGLFEPFRRSYSDLWNNGAWIEHSANFYSRPSS